MRVCATDFVYHAFLNPNDGQRESVLEKGLRPLSDFPESERWKQIEAHMPGFFENLYNDIAKPVVQKPYANSGVFIAPIDFQLLPGSLMYNKTRLKIPITRIDPAHAVLTYVLNEERIRLPLTRENLMKTAEIWDDKLVTEWFAKDPNRMFFYVPQIAAYQPNGIPVTADDIETFE
ncbi:MAG: hypothetical protein HYZ24_15155 [Chloroflexi bacterium]|jgi:hypothetical protein|nr:hypothetical protein [Chloroflexota bacterium]